MKKLIFIIYIIVSSLIIAQNIKAPDFCLQDQNLETHTLEKYRGKTIFLIFWTSQCNYCLEELEIVEKLFNVTKKNTGNIIFLTFNSEEEKELKDFLEQKEYSFPVIRDNIVFHQYYIESYPTTYIINEKGKIIQSIIGKLKQENFEQLIKDPTTIVENY